MSANKQLIFFFFGQVSSQFQTGNTWKLDFMTTSHSSLTKPTPMQLTTLWLSHKKNKKPVVCWRSFKNCWPNCATKKKQVCNLLSHPHHIVRQLNYNSIIWLSHKKNKKQLLVGAHLKQCWPNCATKKKNKSVICCLAQHPPSVTLKLKANHGWHPFLSTLSKAVSLWFTRFLEPLFGALFWEKAPLQSGF